MAETKKLDARGTVPTSVRVTPACSQLWDLLSGQMGLSKTGVLETAIRRLAKEEGVQASEGTESTGGVNA